MYQEIPEIFETLFRIQPCQSDSSSSSNDVGKTDCEVEVVMEWNGSSSSSQSSIADSDDSLNGNEDVSSTPESTVVPDNGRGTGSVCSSDSSCQDDSCDTILNQYLHPATYVNVEPKLYKQDE